MKQAGPDSGRGGDWALRLAVNRSTGVPSGPRPAKRLSFVLYLADEDKPQVGLQGGLTVDRYWHWMGMGGRFLWGGATGLW